MLTLNNSETVIATSHQLRCVEVVAAGVDWLSPENENYSPSSPEAATRTIYRYLEREDPEVRSLSKLPGKRICLDRAFHCDDENGYVGS